MKKINTVGLVILGLLFSIYANGQCDLPSELPSNLADLETANRAIAECYAPTIHHMTENTETHSLMGRADLITSVFFDGTESPGDNWNNLTSFQSGNPSTHDELDPLVYYSVVWTDWAWIITYGFYHPRDYAGF